MLEGNQRNIKERVDQACVFLRNLDGILVNSFEYDPECMRPYPSVKLTLNGCIKWVRVYHSCCPSGHFTVDAIIDCCGVGVLHNFSIEEDEVFKSLMVFEWHIHSFIAVLLKVVEKIKRGEK